jgi:hypothetical protein
MIGNFGVFGMLTMLVVWLVPFLIAVFVLVTLAGIRRGVDRVAIAVESLAVAQHPRI